MKLFRQAHKKNTGSVQLFDKPPAVSWKLKTREVHLFVTDIPHEGQGSFDYWVSLTTDDLHQIIEALASRGPERKK